MINVLLFDADGVTIQAPGYGSEFALQSEGLDTSGLQDFFRGVFLECKRGKVDAKKAIIPFLQDWGWQKDVDDFFHIWHRYEHVINHTLIAQIQEYRKQGVLCCLSTDNNFYRMNYIKKEMEFENYFDEIFCSSDIGFLKSEDGFWQSIFERLQVRFPDLKKDEVEVWDDNVENVGVVKRFGFNTVIV
jgi:FMN phosphatase YigB (HAD superfamily)